MGNIWFATTGEGAYRYDGELFTQFTKKDGLNSDCVYAILEDKEGNIWFGTENGACRYVGRSITGSKPNGDGWIRYMLKDKNENIWFGGRGHGNFIFNGKIFSNFTERVWIGNPILIDTSGNIWFRGEEKISTVEIDGGIWCYDGKKFKNYSTNDGISKYFV